MLGVYRPPISLSLQDLVGLQDSQITELKPAKYNWRSTTWQRKQKTLYHRHRWPIWNWNLKEGHGHLNGTITWVSWEVAWSRCTTKLGIWWVATCTPAVLVRNLICTVLVTAFCPHFPKQRRSTRLEMIKITPTAPLYFLPITAFRNSWLCPVLAPLCCL